jgi:hypothetical protein
VVSAESVPDGGTRDALDPHRAPARNATKGRDMHKLGVFLLTIAVFGVVPARAQDIAGMEDCTKTSGLDKRTGCFQSNIEFLNRLVAKNAAGLQQKLSAANAEIGELKRAVAGLQTKLADLQTSLAKLQAGVEQLQPAKKPDAK